jgi:hypothetical protein
MLENIKNFNSNRARKNGQDSGGESKPKKKNSILKKINFFVKNFINFLEKK